MFLKTRFKHNTNKFQIITLNRSKLQSYKIVKKRKKNEFECKQAAKNVNINKPKEAKKDVKVPQ